MMKSIMEESSTILKAIEAAWARAGKPQEFTIKILEHPETGFLGLKTVKSAKIAFFFTETAPKPEPRPIRSTSSASSRITVRQPEQREPREQRDHRDQRDSRSSDYRSQRSPYQRRDQDSRRDSRDSRDSRDPRDSRDSRSERSDYGERSTWTPEMVEAAQEWVKETLVMMDHADVGVKAHVSQNYLKLILDKPIELDQRQEEVLFKSWVGLVFESLQEKLKQPMRGLRLILESKR